MVQSATGHSITILMNMIMRGHDINFDYGFYFVSFLMQPNDDIDRTIRSNDISTPYIVGTGTDVFLLSAKKKYFYEKGDTTERSQH